MGKKEVGEEVVVCQYLAGCSFQPEVETVDANPFRRQCTLPGEKQSRWERVQGQCSILLAQLSEPEPRGAKVSQGERSIIVLTLHLNLVRTRTHNIKE